MRDNNNIIPDSRYILYTKLMSSLSLGRRSYSISFLPIAIVVLALTDFLQDLLSSVVSGISGFIGWMTTEMVELLLFVPQPGNLPELNDLFWSVSFPIFWAGLSVVGSMFFLSMMLSPDQQKADPHRFLSRTLMMIVAILAFGLGAFDVAVAASNGIAAELYPEEYRLELSSDAYEALATSTLAGFAALLFPIVASPKIILTFVLFLTMLGMRVVIILTFYAVFPIIALLWIVDIGPLVYAQKFSQFFIKITAFLLVFGVIIAAILGVGGALGGGATEAVTGEPIGDVEVDSVGSEVEDRESGGMLEDTEYGGTVSGTSQSALSVALIQVYAYLGSLWLVIAITSVILGATVSTGFKRQRLRQRRVKKKASNVSERLKQNLDENKTLQQHVKDTANESVKSAEESFKKAGDQIQESNVPGSDLSGEMMKKAGVNGRKGVEGVVAAAGNIGKGAKKVSNSVDSVYSSVANFDKKLQETSKSLQAVKSNSDSHMISGMAGAGSGLARAGSAYTKVFKQRGMRRSIQAGVGIARESPIGRYGPGDSKTKKRLNEADVKEDKYISDDDIDVEDIHENNDIFDNSRFDIDEVEFRAESSSQTSSNGIKESENGDVIQRGKLVDTDSGEEIPYIGFDLEEDGNGTKLEDGEVYSLNGASMRKWHEEKPFSHPSEIGEYNQVSSDEHTVIEHEPTTDQTDQRSTQTEQGR